MINKKLQTAAKSLLPKSENNHLPKMSEADHKLHCSCYGSRESTFSTCSDGWADWSWAYESEAIATTSWAASRQALAPSPAPAIPTGCLYPSDSPSLHWWRLVALILSEHVECFPLIPLIPKLMACCWCICGLSSWRLRLKNWGGIYTSDLKIALGGNTMLVSLARDINQRPYYYKVQASVGCTVQNYLFYLFSEEVQNYLSIIY